MPERQLVRVSSAEFVRRFGSWQDRAATDPVVVTHHGRPRLVLLSAARYQELTAGGADDAANDGAALRLATLIDRLDTGFVAFDRALGVSGMNSLAANYFRLRGDGAAARDADMPDLLRGPARTHLLRALASGEPASFEAPSVALPGEWLRMQSFPFGDGVGILFRNVTEERALWGTAAADAAFRAALAAHGAIGTAVLSPRGQFVRIDAALAAMTGRSDEAMAAMRLGDLLADGREAADEAVDAILGGGAARALSGLLRTPQGDRPVRIALAPPRGDYAVEGACVVLTAAG